MNLKIILYADNAFKRQKGLMFHPELSETECAFFSFPGSERYAFWNKNVSFDLSLAFVNDKGQIVDILDMPAHSEKSHASKHNAQYVIETKKGVFGANNIGVGDYIEFNTNNINFVKG